MPQKLPAYSPPAQPAGQTPANPQAPAGATPPRAASSSGYGGYKPPSAAAVATPPPPAPGEEDFGPRHVRRRAEDFGNLTAGDHTLVCGVDSILDFGDGVKVGWTVIAGPERDRELGWNQSPPPFCYPPAKSAAASMSIWFRTLCEAYAACGYPFETWLDTGDKTTDGGPIKTPPYWLFFAHECADGIHVPILFNVRVRCDAGHEKYPKVQSVAPYLINGQPVQAPMPRRLIPDIENAHRWTGVADSFTIGKGERAGTVVPFVKLDWKQLSLGHGGLKTYKDVQS